MAGKLPTISKSNHNMKHNKFALWIRFTDDAVEDGT
jgi:hypothetical protein